MQVVLGAQPATTIEQAIELADSQPNWLVGYKHTSEDVGDFLNVLTAHADASLWARLHKDRQMDYQGGPHTRGTEAWAGMVAQEILRMQDNLKSVNEAAFAAIAVQIQRRALFSGQYDTFSDLEAMIRDVAPNLSRSHKYEALAFAEQIAPWLEANADMCVCGHPRSDHNSKCQSCQRDDSVPEAEKCSEFRGPPKVNELWIPGSWERLRPGLPMLKQIVSEAADGTRSVSSAIRGIWTVVNTFTNEKLSVTDLRAELALKKPDPIWYRTGRVHQIGEEPHDQEVLYWLEFPELTKKQRAMVLGLLGIRAKQKD